jgi:hypothetical protein
LKIFLTAFSGYTLALQRTTDGAPAKAHEASELALFKIWDWAAGQLLGSNI